MVSKFIHQQLGCYVIKVANLIIGMGYSLALESTLLVHGTILKLRNKVTVSKFTFCCVRAAIHWPAIILL